MSSEHRLRLRCAERAVERMAPAERAVFLAIRVDELSYPEIAAELDMSVAEVERHFAASLAVLVNAMDEKEPWWWKFWPW